MSKADDGEQPRPTRSGPAVRGASPYAALEREVVELRSALHREQRVLAALRDVGTALGTTLDLNDLLELILGRLTEVLDADRSTLYLVDEEQGELVSRLVVGESVKSIRVKIGHGVAGIVAQTGRAIRIASAYDDPRFEKEWDVLTGYRTTSMLAAPLKNHVGRTIGVIQVLNKAEGTFTDEDEAILQVLSTQAAVAIDNSMMFLRLVQKNRQLQDTKEELERRVDDLQLLFELERATGRAQSFEELVTAALSVACHACDARGAAMIIAEEESGDIAHYLYDGSTPERLERSGIKSGEGLLGHVMNRGAPLNLEDARGDGRQSASVEGRYAFVVQSVLAVPLEGEGRSIGAMGLFSKQSGRVFTQEDESLMRLVGANLSTAVRLFRASEAREIGQRLTAIGRLLSQVIHDFKTPMSVISGHVQLMQDAADAATRKKHAREILRQFEALVSMQREVLEFARGERSLFVRRVFLHEFFEDLRAQLSHSVDGRAIELDMSVNQRLVARFDQGRMTRAVLNLTRNAVEAMAHTGGRVTIHAERRGDEIVIVVSDTGPGIPPEIEGRLFQSFVTAGKSQGTGLGLAIVKKIVDEHSGRIEYSSTPRGTTFELFLPQPPEPPPVSVAPPALALTEQGASEAKAPAANARAATRQKGKTGAASADLALKARPARPEAERARKAKSSKKASPAKASPKRSHQVDTRRRAPVVRKKGSRGLSS